jgi:hypothetical protein
MQTDNRLYLPALLEYRAKVSRRRAAAFCDAPEYVLGSEVRPLTPATFSMLHAVGNAFVTGARPEVSDVRDYLWFHSPLYGHCGVKDWRQRKRKALRRFGNQACAPWRKWLGRAPDLNRFRAVMAMAVSEIEALVNDAFADAPPRSGTKTRPTASLEASLIDEFASSYRWEPERTRNTPLRQLFLLLRCIRAGRGQEVGDDGENEIIYAHLRARNDAIAAERATKTNGVNHG